MQLTSLDYVIQLALQFSDPVTDMTAVCLQLALPWTSCAYSAAKPGQILPVTRQTGQQIGELCQLHLNDAFPRLCSPGKNIQNQLCTVNDF
ncbi:hypothetical protein D3C73_1126800 [compost metagenome]